MKHKWLFNALAVLFLITGLFGGFANTPVAVAATGESTAADKIEPALLEKFTQEGTTDFIVRFVEQADLSPAYSMGWDERGDFVYNTLQETATRTQARTKGMLDAAGLEYTTFIAGNDLYVKSGTLAVATSLAELDEVSFIRITRTYNIDPVKIENPLANVSWSGELLAQKLNSNIDAPSALAWGIVDAKADQFWQAFGVQGDGIKVANIDTGVQWDHPALDQAFACPGDPGNANCWSDPENWCGGTACDNNGHGTHTMGTMVADDDPSLTWQAGMAPNATWIACKGCGTSSCSDFALNSCADWILAPGGNAANRPNVVNNSWGGGSGDPWYLAKVQAWVAAGTFPAFSAGNNYTCSSMGDPGTYQESFASASHTSARIISDFSSKGPSPFGHDPYTKPNISAPGSSVCSTVPGGGWSCGYSGTSMASPHSAGAVALLWSCDPSLVGQVDATFQALQNAANTPPAGSCGAPPDNEGNYTYGYGFLDVLAAGTGICGGVSLGTLEGYVFDNNGNPVEGASVMASPALDQNEIQAITDPSGFYSMDLVVGFYDVTASKQNYTSQTQLNVEVISGTTVTLPDFILTFLGAWTELDPLPGCPDWTRYDGEYFPGDGMVYFMGGRSGTDTFGDIYELDLTTGTCTDTTANMVTAISNYTIVPLNVGGDDVLCTFGGRDPAGNNTNDVQCYDPVANTVSVVTDLPASIAPFTPAAAVGVNNKAYVFGGFRATTSPYETAETWEWDPATNAWTQKGNLVQALGYIQAVEANGLIYGFGGTVFDGTNLVTQVKTQLFDPAAGTWNDAAIAELPTAGAEGRTFFVNGGQIVVAGGGQWPADTADVYLYDIASDTYDYSFPDLNITRRDQAGVQVPGTPDTMWVFGGRSSATGYGGDSPPYGPPEYYEMVSLDPDIAVNPTFLDEIVQIDTPKTVNLDVMNVGGGVITWTLFEDTAALGFPLVDWSDNFDGYANDSQMHGQGGWKGWFNDPNAGAFVRDDFAHSAPHSVEITGASDLVHEYSGYTTGAWTYTAWQYIPSSATGITYFILLNSYDDGGVNLNWSLEMQFDLGTDTLFNDGPDGGTLPIIYDQWVEIRNEIDLDNDTQSVFYGGDLLFSGSWTEGMSGGGVLNIAAVDLFANGAAPVYYDDISLVGAVSDICDSVTDIPWLSTNPTSGVTPGGTATPVDVTFDPTGMGIGVYTANLCAASNDADEPMVVIPVTMNIVEFLPDIEVDPLFFDVTVFVDEPATYDMDIMNVGTGDLNWEIFEIPDTLAFVPSTAILGGTTANPGLTLSGPAGTLVTPDAPANPEVVLWDQPLSGVNQNAYVDQDFTDVPDFSSYLADDFVAADDWSIETIFVPGNGWNGFTTLMNATSLTWAVYEDNAGVPAGYPGGGDPAVWSISLAPTDSQVVITNGSGGMPSNTTLNLTTPATIPAGTYWLVFYPSMPFSGGGQFGRQPADTLNGYTGQFINPGGGFGYGSNWQSWAIIGATQQDIAFRIEGEIVVLDVPWLSEDPVSGQNDTTVAVTFDPTGMAIGQYFATLAIESNDTDEPVVYVPVTMTIIVKEAGVLLTPETDADAGDPGTTVTYMLTLENTGNIADTFTVEATGVWATNLPVSSFDLGPGETVDFVVEVTVPAGAMAGDSDVTTVTATSVFDDSVSDSSALTTTANQVYGIELTPATAGLTGAPGDVVTYTLTLTNVGNGEDTVTLALAGNLWDTELPVASFTLAAGASVEVTVLVTIPADAVDGATDVVTVTATSEGGPTASSVLTTTAEIVPPEGFIIFLPIQFKH